MNGCSRPGHSLEGGVKTSRCTSTASIKTHTRTVILRDAAFPLASGTGMGELTKPGRVDRIG